ncbi:MAG: flagellar biosynthetic protein FliO, partial [Phycisphaeraceae bacterium]
DRDTASLARLNTPAPDTTTATASEGDTAAAHPSRDDEPLGTPASETRPLGPGDDVPAGSATDGSWMLNTLGSLAVVIGLILAIRWAWQKVGGQPAAAGHSPVVEVLSRTAVAPRNHILLVRVGPRILVVGDSAAGLRTLANVDEPDEVADLLQAVTAAHHGRSFSRTLDRFSAEHDAHAYDPELGGDNSEHLVDRARDSLSSLLSRLRTAAGKGGTNP